RVNAFGGEFYEVIIGGAAFNKEVEAFFKKMVFPFTVGYGMTECAPIITYDDWKEAKLYSCGKAAPNMEIRINSEDPVNIPGEVLVKGANVFLGYYKNEDATASALTDDGWFHTGDMGVLDGDGALFLRGRSKCMILGPSGQNIYPEEIETVINTRPYVIDSLVIEDDGGLTALIYPDFPQGEADGMSQEALGKYMTESLPELNKELPNYARIKKIEIMPEDFERTPKKSIKRYLYQRN
ncbi:MAG: AMP-binding protein, partial [Bacteroidales bacterium]|nr:AMP-binding protein [Bacteroidales bacterium]